MGGEGIILKTPMVEMVTLRTIQKDNDGAHMYIWILPIV